MLRIMSFLILVLPYTSLSSQDNLIQFPEKSFCGFYEFQNPVFLVRDPEIVRTILVEKFNCFHDNKFQMSEKNDDIFGLNPFILTGSRWKESRGVIVTGLTASKIRVIEDIVKTVYKDISNFITINSSDIEVMDLTTRFTSETVAIYGWGIRSNGFSPDSVIKSGFDKIQSTSVTTIMLNPFLTYWLRISLFPSEFRDFLWSITQQVLCNSEKTKTTQSSLIQSLIMTKEKLRNSGKDLTMKEIIGHLATFYLDGYETTARVLGYTLYALMVHPEVQKKLREEILESGEDFTVDFVNKMEYLDMVLSEVTRLYSPVPFLGRKCTKNCVLNSVEIEKGTYVVIPTLSLHLDPKYYPDPKNFNPENFSEENKKNRHTFTYLAFGQGPRICLGMKFALAEIKLVLCYILKEFEIVTPVSHPVISIKPGKKSSFILIPDEPLYIRFQKL
ncbi:cytochrome P450 9e2-like isoform X2 [Lycorma delicatula]|uniref:cytochrome P450 9e2-like isoform X2 n=1 Tax=Lycorma delicatula TaxID=130591 RepID=UPI003F518567